MTEKPDPIELLGVAEDIFACMPFDFPPALPAMAAGFALLLERVSNGECADCECAICQDIRIMVETAAREMP
jgi:hypothetical protein